MSIKNDFPFNPFIKDWRNLNEPALEILLEEARRYENYLLEASDRISQRIFSIISILIPIVAALLTYTIGAFINNENTSPLPWFGLFAIIALMGILFRLGKAILPRMTEGIGTRPKDGFIKEFIGLDSNFPKSKLPMTLAVLQSIQTKTQTNWTESHKRWMVLKLCLQQIWVLFALEVLALLIFIII